MNIESKSKLTRSDAGNCWVYGCATVVVVGIVGAILAVVGVKYAYNQVVETYTDETAIAMPIVEATEEEQTTMIDRYDTWMQALDSEEGAEALHLSEQDINVLIQHHPDFEDASDVVYISIDDDEIEGEVSVPLNVFADELGLDKLKGRYFNGSLKVDVELKNGVLKVFASEASLKGEPIPDEFMTGIRGQNLAENNQNDPDMQELMENLESIEIIDGELVITPKNLAKTE